MTRYIDTHTIQKLVRTIGPEAFMVNLSRYISADYLRWNEFEKCARVADHSATGVIELMPVSDRRHYAFKYVNGHPQNTRANMLTVMAFGALADVRTGYPMLLSELTITTALRTAATSALAAQWMAKKNPRSMAMIGNGAQSEFQALAFRALLGIQEIRAYDIDPAATRKLMHNLAGIPGLRIVPARSVHEAVAGADIVTTVTADKKNATILTPDMIEAGMHINAVGGDCPGKTELHAEILAGARVVVEYEPQTRIEGDIQQMPGDFPVTELWEVLAGRQPGRGHEQEVTVFDSVGFALEDFSALRYLHDLAERLSLGARIDLVPAPADPKNLYQYVAPATVSRDILRMADDVHETGRA
jgi:ornithine cyclodeaminase